MSPVRIPTAQIAPSLLSCDFARLADQVNLLMDAGAQVMHVDHRVALVDDAQDARRG